MNGNRFQILALDGGGIKGLFSAAVLAFLEKDLNTRIIDHFDIIVGTSTGGIIALALGIAIRPQEVVEFYVNEGAKIFPKNSFHRLRHLFRSKYDSTDLEKTLKSCFGDKCLVDSKKRLVIPSYDIGHDDVYIFKTPHHERLKRDYRVPLWKVAMATSAAPTYFPSFRSLDYLRLVDGGVWANNPTMVGIIEAVSLLEVPLTSIHVLNLGTTDEVKGRSKKLDRGGILQWRKDAVEVILRGQSVGVFAQSQHLLGADHVTRIDPKVPEGFFRLDKLSVEELQAKAAFESRKYSPLFEQRFLSHKASKYEPLNK